jgi:hypothetical protein
MGAPPPPRAPHQTDSARNAPKLHHAWHELSPANKLRIVKDVIPILAHVPLASASVVYTDGIYSFQATLHDNAHRWIQQKDTDCCVSLSGTDFCWLLEIQQN